jgi:short-subunit dehydrogenase
MKTIHGKRALVTGAASGIGRAIALALAREGADLYLLDINAAALANVADEVGKQGTEVIAERCDLARPEQISAAVQALLQRWDHLDILVNNAGVSYHGKTEAMPAERWDAVLGINLLAPIQLIRELLPTLIARGDAHILNVCSILGLVAIPKFAAYQASKFGLVGLSESLRAEYACRGLGVTALCPGFVQTNIFRVMVDGQEGKPMRTPPKWFFTSAEQVAAKAIQAIYRNRGVITVSLLARFLWFIKRMAPRLWDFANRTRKRKSQKPFAATATEPLGIAKEPPSPDQCLPIRSLQESEDEKRSSELKPMTRAG